MTHETGPNTPETSSAAGPHRRHRTVAAAALGAVLAAGAAGLWSVRSTAQETAATVAPVQVTALAPSDATAVRGDVAEIFGNKFILQDATGRTLVETGREGEGRAIVARGETVTVQGKYDKGFLHARLITRADGSVTRLGREGGPKGRGKGGWDAVPDQAALTRAAETAGYTDVRVTGRSPKHLEMVAKAADGTERRLHVGFDGRVRERPAS